MSEAGGAGARPTGEEPPERAAPPEGAAPPEDAEAPAKAPLPEVGSDPLYDFEQMADGVRDSMFGLPVQRITGLVIVVIVIIGLMFGIRATQRQEAAASQSPSAPAVTQSATP